MQLVFNNLYKAYNKDNAHQNNTPAIIESKINDIEAKIEHHR